MFILKYLSEFHISSQSLPVFLSPYIIATISIDKDLTDIWWIKF